MVRGSSRSGYGRQVRYRSICRRHFWTVVKRGAGGFLSPEKYGFNGCIPAEMNSVEGSSGGGISENDGNRMCSRSSKNERNPSRSSAVVRTPPIVAPARLATLRSDPLWRPDSRALAPARPTSPRGTPVSLMSGYRRYPHESVTASCRSCVGSARARPGPTLSSAASRAFQPIDPTAACPTPGLLR